MKLVVTIEEYNSAARAYLGLVWFNNSQALLDVHMEYSKDKQELVFDPTRDRNGDPVKMEAPDADPK